MKSKLVFILLVVAQGTLAYILLSGQTLSAPWIWGITCLMLILTFLLYRIISKSVNAVQTGMSLLREQDFNSSLVTVGQPEVDRIVKLFNSLMEQLKNERLRFLEQSNFHKLVMDASPLGITILDFDGKIQTSNPSFLSILEISEEETIKGKTLSEIPGDMARALSRLPLGETESVRLSDMQIYRCSHLSFMDSGFRRSFYMVESLTREVMKAEKTAYEKVIRMLAHEVNNTMGGVGSLLQTLEDIHSSEPDISEAIESSRERCSSLSTFVTSFANVVKIPMPATRRVDLNEEVRRLLPFFEGMASDGIKVTATLSDEPASAEIDPVLMDQVFVNIVKNAIESIRESGKADNATGLLNIRVNVTPQGNSEIEFSDNGIGISEETSQKLFTPFFSTKADGQGLGLLIISEILRRHSAHFSLKTDPADTLTHFRIRF